MKYPTATKNNKYIIDETKDKKLDVGKGRTVSTQWLYH